MKALTPTNIIAVEVPKDSIRIKKFDLKEYDDQETGFSLEWLIKGNSFYDAKLIPVDFEILGEVRDTEISFDTYPHIEKDYFDDYGYDEMITIERMWDYEEKSFSLESSEESFRSLLQSNGLYFEHCCGNLIDDGVVGETCCHKPNGIKGKLIILKQK